MAVVQSYADCQSNAAGLSRQTAPKFLPSRAAVSALENSADIFAAGYARAGRETPRCALSRIKRRVNNFGIRWIHYHIATASAGLVRRGRLQDHFPTFACISCLEEPAFAAVRPQIPHCRDVSDLRFLGIDNNARNGAAVF